MPLPVRVRPARPDELGALGALTVAAYTATGALSPRDEYLQVLGDPAGRSVGCDLLVAVDGADRPVAGVSLVHPGSPEVEVAGADECEIRALAVDPAAQGRGVAAALLAECLHRAADAGYPAVALCVLAGNDRAHRLYRRAGFTRTPERDWAPAPGVDLLAYRLTLPVRRTTDADAGGR